MAKRKRQLHLDEVGPQLPPASKQEDAPQYRAVGRDYLPGSAAFEQMALYEAAYGMPNAIHTSLATLLDCAPTLVYDSAQRIEKVTTAARKFLGEDLRLNELSTRPDSYDQKVAALRFLIPLEAAETSISGIATEYRSKLEQSGIRLEPDEIARLVKKKEQQS